MEVASLHVVFQPSLVVGRSKKGWRVFDRANDLQPTNRGPPEHGGFISMWSFFLQCGAPQL